MSSGGGSNDLSFNATRGGFRPLCSHTCHRRRSALQLRNLQTKISQLIWTHAHRHTPWFHWARCHITLSENISSTTNVCWQTLDEGLPHLLRLGGGLTLCSLLHLGASTRNPGPLYCNTMARILHEKLQGFVNKSTEILRFQFIPKLISTPSSLIIFLNHLIASGSPTVIRRSPGCFRNKKCRKKCSFSYKYHVLQQIASPYPDTLYIIYFRPTVPGKSRMLAHNHQDDMKHV